MDDDFDDEGKYNVVTHVATFPAPKLRKFHRNERGQDTVGGQVVLGKELNAGEKVKRWEKELNTAKGGGSGQAGKLAGSRGAGGSNGQLHQGLPQTCKT